VAYGSELASEVQFLRAFRDQSVKSTFAGSSFMKAFNNYYYSFSPTVAHIIEQHSFLSEGTRLLLCPLLTALHVASGVFHRLEATQELAAILSGIVASTLIGLAYLGPGLVILRILPKRIEGSTLRRVLQNRNP
jgi:peptidyl-prolyl cis-trans isomerase B (cyclophilin B)